MDILKFLNDNKDGLSWLFGSGIILAVLGGIYKLVSSLIHARRARKTRSNENFPFKVLPPNSNVAKEILGGADHDPLADRNIPYQQRIAERNMRRELEDALTRSHYVLIVGKTGLGKTREAIHIAESLNKEGWTILYLTREQWLSAPAKLPEGLPERKLLFLLDDLNRKMYASRVEQSPKADELMEPLTVPLQQRLEETLETFETLCGKSEVMVIGTARNETFSQFEGEPSEWDKLEFRRYTSFWNQFTLFELPEPNDEAEINFLNQTTDAANVKAKSSDFGSIAKRNDGTFANMVENIKTAVNKDIEFGLDSFRDSLNGTWEKRYKDATTKFTLAGTVYDAIDLCREAKLGLSFNNVYSVAFLFLNNSRIMWLVDVVRIFLTIRSLEKTENILNPRDGQIEAKGYRIEMKQYLPRLYRQVFYETAKTNSKLKNLLLWIESRLLDIPMSTIATERINFEEISSALFDNLAFNLINLGTSYGNLGYSELQILCYKKSLALSKWNFFNHRTIRLGTVQWSNLGYAYSSQKQYEQAINAYQKAIEIDPKFADAWSGLINIYADQNNYISAIAVYQKAIDLDSKNHRAHREIGLLHAKSGDYWEAQTAFQKAIEVNPNDIRARISMIALWHELGIEGETTQYSDFIAQYISKEIEYQQIRFDVVCGNFEKGLERLQRHCEKVPYSKISAQRDFVFKPLRDDPRFKELVGLE